MTKMSTESNEAPAPERRRVVKYTTAGKNIHEIVADLTDLASAGFEVDFYLEDDAKDKPNWFPTYRHPHLPYNPGISTPRTPVTPYVTYNDNTIDAEVNHGFIDTPQFNRIAGAGL